MGFAMDSDIGRFIQPATAFNLDGLKGADFQTAEQVLFYVANAVFNAPLFVTFADVAGHWFKPVMSGKIQVARIEQRLFTTGMAQT